MNIKGKKTRFIFLGLFLLFFFSYVNAKESSAKVIMVGDSRTVEIKKFVEEELYWEAEESDDWDGLTEIEFICKSGKGYRWFVDSAIDQVNAIKEPGDSIVIWMGVNDYRSSSYGDSPYFMYAQIYNYLADYAWTDCDIYVASVGYVDRNRIRLYYGKDNRSNSKAIGSKNGIRGIKEFNEKLQENLSDSINWIDLETVIGIKANDNGTANGFWRVNDNGLTDGLHYSMGVIQAVLYEILNAVS